MPRSGGGFKPDPLRLDAAPLLAALVRAEVSVPSLGPRDKRAVGRARETGTISRNVADRLCMVVLGKHPAEVYGTAWYEGEADD